MTNKGFVIVVSAPSGCGKDTVIAEVLKKLDAQATLSVSMTTRAMRDGEQEGVNYFYVTKEQFMSHIENGDMLEYTEYCGNFYGTPKGQLAEKLRSGSVILVIMLTKFHYCSFSKLFFNI
mgnify:CR=1 FL=1